MVSFSGAPLFIITHPHRSFQKLKSTFLFKVLCYLVFSPKSFMVLVLSDWFSGYEIAWMDMRFAQHPPCTLLQQFAKFSSLLNFDQLANFLLNFGQLSTFTLLFLSKFCLGINISLGLCCGV